jgi:hypothetical protein
MAAFFAPAHPLNVACRTPEQMKLVSRAMPFVEIADHL